MCQLRIVFPLYETLSVDTLTLFLSLPTPQPAPASETVDHTLPENTDSHQDATDEFSAVLLTPEPEPQETSSSLLALPSRLSTETSSSSDSETDDRYERTQTTKARARGQIYNVTVARQSILR